jgi:hypothetical protein
MAGAEGRTEGDAGFPVYRRTSDGLHHYRILAADRFEEVQRIGRRYVFHDVLATAYPERVRVAEMIAVSEGRYLPSNAEEWDRVMDHVHRR